jgi:hypothetical protein
MVPETAMHRPRPTNQAPEPKCKAPSEWITSKRHVLQVGSKGNPSATPSDQSTTSIPWHESRRKIDEINAMPTRDVHDPTLFALAIDVGSDPLIAVKRRACTNSITLLLMLTQLDDNSVVAMLRRILTTSSGAGIARSIGSPFPLVGAGGGGIDIANGLGTIR